MTAIINGVTCMGTPQEILTLMQLAGEVEYNYTYSGTRLEPAKTYKNPDYFIDFIPKPINP